MPPRRAEAAADATRELRLQAQTARERLHDALPHGKLLDRLGTELREIDQRLEQNLDAVELRDLEHRLRQLRMAALEAEERVAPAREPGALSAALRRRRIEGDWLEELREMNGDEIRDWLDDARWSWMQRGVLGREDLPKVADDDGL